MEHPAERLTSFQAGGALRESSLYVERRADAELHEGLARGDRCAVIAPRQMGKSSLRRRVERRLAASGVRCLSVDLAAIGAQGVTRGQWFYALSLFLAERSEADIDLLQVWKAQRRLAPAHRFTHFLCEELIPRVPAHIAVFIDELDVALGLPFPPDDFFAALAATASPRLTFCLLGVTEPKRWTQDPARSPAADWRVIRPLPFTLEEAAAFLPGLRAGGGDPEALLTAILARTGGHPYLTQRICELLVRAGAENGGAPEDRVAHVVDDGFLEDRAVRALRPR